ncbi:MAG: hypothetical protein ACLFUP_10005, partial [Desulfobacteraceae bacterium]
RGLSEHEIPWFVRDLLYALNRSGAAPLERVDRELSELGWDRSLLDDHLLELILYLVKEDVEQASR